MLLWIVLAPLVGAVVNGLVFATGFWRRSVGGSENVERKIVSALGPGVILVSAVLSSILFFRLLGLEGDNRRFIEEMFVWIPSGSFTASFELLLDPISAVMVLVVTWVSFLIHVYSIGYMHADRSYSRYFTYLNIFVFFMLILVLANNFVLMFVGWEGVGLASYLLIGFWYEDSTKAYAGRKAFIVNRIGDFGFILGILLIFFVFSSVNYQEVFAKASAPGFVAAAPDGIITIIALLLFIGAVGKSAQFPLFVWLPDAMAGPTPVSALIHAATMVTAGVYMLARCNVFYSASPEAQLIVVSVAAFTAFMAATIALTQNDIKKILAYSTVSQLGYMFMGVGSGAYAAGMFHLLTHAFFKALLFLGAGSVIHALAQEQDIRKMGGIRKDLPITALTFLVGTLAISGFPFLSGFFSKDEILSNLYLRGYTVHWIIGIVTAVLTAFYMLRLYLLTFEGRSRVPGELRLKVHESPRSMWLPLVILAFFSLIGGIFGIPEFMGKSLGLEHSNLFEGFISSALHSYPSSHITGQMFGHWTLLMFSVIAGFVGLLLAYNLYFKKTSIPDEIVKSILLKPLYKFSLGRWFVDEIYDFLILRPYRELSKLSAYFDNFVIDGLVGGVGYVVRESSYVLRAAQSGILRLYVGVMAMGVVAIIVYMLFRAL